jgi:hypothetical protein
VSSFDERRRARATWSIRAIPLGREELVDARDGSSVDERIALVWKLTEELWAFSGRAIPDYPRRDMPGAILRPR